MTTIEKIKELTARLNEARCVYYNENRSIMSDFEYDKLFDSLQKMEKETGVIFTGSPTQTVGYEVKSELPKIRHSHSLLSLDKTKSIEKLNQFIGNKKAIMSLKMDGLTCMLTYRNGELVLAETRGNGEVGEEITHNAKVFTNIPLHIIDKGELKIEGEAIITYDDFESINAPLEKEEKYKTPRNLASGSVRQLDSKITASRHVKFIVWKVDCVDLGSFSNRLEYARSLGFDIVPYRLVDCTEDIINELKTEAEVKGYPIDGLVCTYDDITYGESLGMTGRFPRHSIAFKFYDEEFETTIRNIDWTLGKSGVITPTAIFDPIDIDGTTITRASLHNISIMNSLELSEGDTITVYKANQIIPQISDNISKMNNNLFIPPKTCPICEGRTAVVQDNDSKVLICSNADCSGKLLKRLVHFCSRDAINIDGMSESTLQFLIDKGWVNKFKDLYHLKQYQAEWETIPGFGKVSVEKKLTSIEKSRMVTLKQFLYSLSIPLIGRSASSTIEKYVIEHSNNILYSFLDNIKTRFDWTRLNDFGTAMSDSLNNYSSEHFEEIEELGKEFSFESFLINQKYFGRFVNKNFVISGSLFVFENRNKLIEDIEINGGKVSGSMSKNIDYLITNDKSTGSSKIRKAIQLGIKIISEKDYLSLKEGVIM